MLKYIGYLVGLGVIFISGVYMPYNAIERWSREMYYKQYETDRVNAMLRGFGGDERRFADCYLVEELGVKIGRDCKDYCLKHNRICVLDEFTDADGSALVRYRPLESDCDFDEYLMSFIGGRFVFAYAMKFHRGQDAARRTFGDVKTAVERKYGCQMFDEKEVDASLPLYRLINMGVESDAVECCKLFFCRRCNFSRDLSCISLSLTADGTVNMRAEFCGEWLGLADY